MTRDPALSFGLPVRNGAETIGAAIESVLAQTYEDWELVISDNLSTDGTSEICAAFAAQDSRIRHLPAKRDLAQNENFCEVFRASRGRYFRWHGDDDWLEKDYARRSVEALERHPSAVLCTTVIQYHDNGAARDTVDAVSELGGVHAADPVERVRELFALFEAGDLIIDPVYSTVRSSEMRKTGLIGPYRFGDFILACELALRGRWVHVQEVLAHRQLAIAGANREQLRSFTNRDDWTNLVQREISLIKVFQLSGGILTFRERARLVPVLLGFFKRERAHGLRRRWTQRRRTTTQHGPR